MTACPGRTLLLAGLLLALACASVEDRVRSLRAGPSPPRARVAVDIWSGFTQRPGATRTSPGRVEILLDLTRSMRAPTPGGPPRYAAARTAALRLVRELPPDEPIDVRALGVTKGDADCAGPYTVQRGTRSSDARALAALLAPLEPASEASLAGALEALRHDLDRDSEGARVVLFTDLGAECGGDLCAAAEQLVEAGAALDLVLLSDAVVPQCFAQLTPGGQPRVAPLEIPEARAGFRVEAYETGSAAVGDVLARGRTDGRPVAVKPGAVTIVLELDPPSVIGPLALREGTLTRVRVLDFPTLEPPVREWRWDVSPFEPGEDTE